MIMRQARWSLRYHAPPSPRRAMVLIIVLVVIVALSLGALTFSALMLGEHEVANATGRQIQAATLAESGIEAIRKFLAQQSDVQYGEGEWYTNAEQFQGVLVVDDEIAQFRGRFSIFAPGQITATGEMRFGLVCESAKLNLNTLLTTSGSTANTNTTSTGTTSDNATSDNTTENTANENTTSTNTASTNTTSDRDRLMALPEMTEDIADAILDWLDEDDEPREFGAEADYYESLGSPYRPTNGPIASLEELLFVRGVTASLLYGGDRNRNGVIDTDESDASGGTMPLGWSAYLTIYSREGIRREDGSPKINLNQDDAKTLYEQLENVFDADWANFIIAYRQQAESNSSNESSSSNSDQNNQNNSDDENASTRNSGGNNNSTSNGESNNSGTITIEYADRVPEQPDLTKPLSKKIDSILELVGAQVTITSEDGKKQTIVKQFANESEAMRDYLPKLTAHTTTDSETMLEGRINVNLAPVNVLTGIPGIDEVLAEEIVMQRSTDPSSLDDYQRDATWLLIDGLVSLDEMKKLLPYVTAGGSVYLAQSVGFFDERGPVVRLEAVLDATESPPRMLSLRNLTTLGRGFDPTDLGAQQ